MSKDRVKFTVHKVLGKSVGPGTPCRSKREANQARENIAKAALVAKDAGFPVVYDQNGNFVVANWQR